MKKMSRWSSNSAASATIAIAVLAVLVATTLTHMIADPGVDEAVVIDQDGSTQSSSQQQLQMLDVISPEDGQEVYDGFIPVRVELNERSVAANRHVVGDLSGLQLCIRWAADSGCDARRDDSSYAIAKHILNSDGQAQHKCMRPPMDGKVMFTANCWVMEFVFAVLDTIHGTHMTVLQTEYRNVNVVTVDEHVHKSYPALKQTPGGKSGLFRHASRLVQKNRNPATLGGMGMSPLVLEFGTGVTTMLLGKIFGEWKTEPVAIHTFDSFMGLPEQWRDGFGKGFDYFDGEFPTYVTDLKNVEVHRGWFNEILPTLLKETTDAALSTAPVNLLVIDVCLETSAEFVLEHLVCRLTEGSIVIFGSYFNYAGWNSTRGEYSAWASAVKKYDLQFRPIAFHGTAILLEILEFPRKCIKQGATMETNRAAATNADIKKWATKKMFDARIANDKELLQKELEEIVAVDQFNAEALGLLAYVAEDIHRIADRLEYARRALLLQHQMPPVNSTSKEFLASLQKAPMKEVFSRSLPVHRLRHDLEQLRYLKELGRLPNDLVNQAIRAYEDVFANFSDIPLSKFVTLSWEQFGKLGPYFNRVLYLPPISRVSPTALSSAVDFSQILSEYDEKAIVVVDNFLSQEALNNLLRYYREATVFYDFVHPSYLGSYLVEGLGNPVLAQVIEEVSVALRPIICDRPLVQAWVYKYDETLERGIKIHADVAAVNFNIWLGEDSNILDPKHSGGLIIYTQRPPDDWDFSMFNSEPTKPEVIEMLEKSGYRNITVPHRQNRMVMFDSTLFHASDVGKWAPGYKARRINLTLLFGRMRSTCD